MSDTQLEWKFVQSFGDDNSSDDDLVTAVDFDETGDYLAVGDKAGRVCVFEGHDQKKPSKNSFFEYKFLTEFQSHESEFDYLKSLEIEEKINMIKWAKRRNAGLFLLACNDKTIKLWKVHQKKPPPLTAKPVHRASGGKIPPLYNPSAKPTAASTAATRKRVYANGHQFHINSLSVNSDGETFVSADDLRINLWNIENAIESFNLVDHKPNNLEELTEVINCAVFHPQSCNLLAYSTSRGSTRLIDLRDSALCDHHSKQFEIEEDPADKTFFSEILSSISDTKFTRDGRYILTRDFLTMRLWDINMERGPVLTINVHEYLNNHLTDLYENDCIFDRFEVDSSPDGTQFLSGSYNNNFVIHSKTSQSTVTIEALKDGPRKGKPSKPTGPAAAAPVASKDKEKDQASPTNAPNVNMMDFGKKALHAAWHPRLNVVAVAGLNKLYIYQGKPAKAGPAGAISSGAAAAPSPTPPSQSQGAPRPLGSRPPSSAAAVPKPSSPFGPRAPSGSAGPGRLGFASSESAFSSPNAAGPAPPKKKA